MAEPTFFCIRCTREKPVTEKVAFKTGKVKSTTHTCCTSCYERRMKVKSQAQRDKFGRSMTKENKKEQARITIKNMELKNEANAGLPCGYRKDKLV